MGPKFGAHCLGCTSLGRNFCELLVDEVHLYVDQTAAASWYLRQRQLHGALRLCLLLLFLSQYGDSCDWLYISGEQGARRAGHKFSDDHPVDAFLLAAIDYAQNVLALFKSVAAQGPIPSKSDARASASSCATAK